MKRAGDVVGTPDWQLDLMIQNERERVWERLNAEPEINRDQLVKLLTKAIDQVSDASDYVLGISEEVDGTLISSKLDACRNHLDSVWYELRQIMKEVET